MLHRCLATLTWFLNLFNPPPLDSMNWQQKVGRVLLVTVSLAVSSILLAMAAALAVFLVQRGRTMLLGEKELLSGALIVFVAIVVNTCCVIVLLHMRQADRQLMAPPPDENPPQL